MEALLMEGASRRTMLPFVAVLLAVQNGSLLGNSVSRSTGQNGYEEYLRAADVIRNPDEGIYANWNPGTQPMPRNPNLPDDPGLTPATIALYRHLNALTPLEVHREELKKFGEALQLIRRGNGKAVADPHVDMGPDTVFSEYTSFRAITRFAARAATVYAADGQTDCAVDVLLDQLAFADNIGRSLLISNLVGSAMSTTILASFSDLFPRLCRADALRVERAVGALLARPAAARAVLPAELAFTKEALRKGFAGDGKGLFYDEDDDKADPRAKAMAREFGSMSQAGRAALLARIDAQLDSRALAMDRVLAGPEREWVSGLALLSGEEDENPTDLESAFLTFVTPAYGGYAVTATRSRTQLRLLDLHARLLRYRWDYGRYPDSIEAIDPLTNGPYVYEKRPDGTVRLASKGIAQTGEIELRYRRPALAAEPGGKP